MTVVFVSAAFALKEIKEWEDCDNERRHGILKMPRYDAMHVRSQVSGALRRLIAATGRRHPTYQTGPQRHPHVRGSPGVPTKRPELPACTVRFCMDYLQMRQLIQVPNRHDVLGTQLDLVAPGASKIELKIGPHFPPAAALGESRPAAA
jgi:hypothetical protein